MGRETLELTAGELTRIAYAAYAKTIGPHMADWESIGLKTRAAWTVAVASVVEAIIMETGEKVAKMSSDAREKRLSRDAKEYGCPYLEVVQDDEDD